MWHIYDKTCYAFCLIARTNEKDADETTDFFSDEDKDTSVLNQNCSIKKFKDADDSTDIHTEDEKSLNKKNLMKKKSVAVPKPPEGIYDKKFYHIELHAYYIYKNHFMLY